MAERSALISDPRAGATALARAEALDGVRRYLQASLAPNTRRAYRHAWEEFVSYCEALRVPALPASPATVAAWLTWLADTQGNRPTTIQIKLSAVAYVHDRFGPRGQPNPARDEQTRTVMAGIRRVKGRPPRQKAPLMLEELEAMIAGLPDDLRGARDRAILLLGFSGAFRRSELVALDVADVVFRAREMVVTLARSKGDQEGRGTRKRIPRRVTRTDLCAARAVREWLTVADIREGPLFRAIDRYGRPRRKRLSAQSVALIVKQAAMRAGLDAARFSGHSLRAGFVTVAAGRRVPEYQIQEVTGHRSADVLRRYIRDAGQGQADAIAAVFGEGG